MNRNNFEFQSMVSQKAVWRRAAGAAAFALLLTTGIGGCKDADKAPIVNSADVNPNGPDPADANLAPANGSAPAGQPTRVAGTSQAYTPQQSSENYGSGQQAPAPIVRGNNAYLNESQNPNAANNTPQQGYADTGQAYDQGYNNGEAEGLAEADQPPPQLAEYDQPPAPADNDLWTPGYWGYANTGYYWVPGAWVAAPYVGALWTPGYWGYSGNRYRWNHGYWGRHIGYYGGINYGWGYIGTGYYGGYWNSNRFYYNRAITRVGPRVQTVYERPVVVNNIRYTSITNNRVSFNGGRGGINYQPRPFEVAAMHEQHTGPLPEQRQFHQQAQMNRANFYTENHGRPAQAVLAQPIATHGFAGPAAGPAADPRSVNRGGFGRPGAQPGQNPAFQGNNNAGGEQRLQMEQQRNQQVQQQHNAQAEQQRNLQMQQAQQHNNAAEQQRNLQQQQHNQMEQQHTTEMQQRSNALEQQRANETVQRNALAQHNQQLEQQRNQQVEQQRNNTMQQHNAEMQQRNAEQAQRNAQIQQQQHVQQQPQRNFQPQAQPRVEQRAEQPRVEQHVEQPRAQPQAQHMEQPHAQAAPRVEQHSAPSPQPQGAHPGGGEGHSGGHH